MKSVPSTGSAAEALVPTNGPTNDSNNNKQPEIHVRIENPIRKYIRHKCNASRAGRVELNCVHPYGIECCAAISEYYAAH